MATSRRGGAGRLQGVGRQPFEQVVERHGPMVLRVCRAVLGPDAAEDAWSETFLSALRAYPDLPPGSNVEAWLVTIAHRKAIDQVRAAARRAVPVAELPDRPGADGVPGGWECDLWAALAALPPKQRQTRRLPLPGRAAVRRGGRGARRHRGRRPPGRRRRHRRAAPQLPDRCAHEGGTR